MNIEIIDTHCHLDDERYLQDLDEVIQRAKNNGVKGILLPAADINDLDRANEISYRYKHIFYAAGVHPDNSKDYDERILRKHLLDNKCIAVGECGLDYFRLPKDGKEEIKNLQKEVFIKQIKLAIEFKKPLIVHIREANQDSYDILKQYANDLVGAVLHCYNSSEILLDLAKYNFYFGIGGVLTFKNAKSLVEVLPKIPKDKILIETDAPYLTPHPFRGQRNEPSYTLYVLEKIAEILHISKEEVSNTTIKNSLKLFKEFQTVA